MHTLLFTSSPFATGGRYDTIPKDMRDSDLYDGMIGCRREARKDERVSRYKDFPRARVRSVCGLRQCGKVKKIAYRGGGHFSWHTDSKDNARHTVTMILYPPQTIRGGTLVVRWRSEGQCRYKPHPTKWRAVFVPLGVEHMVTRLVSGLRICYVIPMEACRASSRSSSSRRAASR